MVNNTVTEIEKEIYRTIKRLQWILKNEGKLDYLSIYIGKEDISFNNEYWHKDKREDKIQLSEHNNIIIQAGGEYLREKLKLEETK